MTALRLPAVGSVELAFARAWARQGARPGDLEWRRIETLRGLAQALEAARATSMRPWLDGLAADASGEQIDTTLRARWPLLVDEAAAWLPERWQSAVQWCACWPDLPRLQHIARGGPWPTAPQHEEPAWQALIDQRNSTTALLGTRWADLAPAWTAPERFAAVWLQAWRARVPPAALAPGRPLAAWLGLMQQHGASFIAAPVHEAWPQRAALKARLVTLLRQAAIDPAVVFIHLSLQALDLERLRAELLRRALFPRWVAV